MMLSFVWVNVSICGCWLLTCSSCSATITSCSWFYTHESCVQPHEILLIGRSHTHFLFSRITFKHLFSLVIPICCCVHCIEGLSNFYCYVLYALCYMSCVELSLYWRLSNLLHYPFELNGTSSRVNYARIPIERTEKKKKSSIKPSENGLVIGETEACYTWYIKLLYPHTHVHIGSIQCSMLAVIEFYSLAKDVLVSHILFLVSILITHELKIDNTTRTVRSERRKKDIE